MDNIRVGFDPLGDPKDGHILTRAIIDTIHEPLIVLDEHLNIIVASKSFYRKFGLTHAITSEKPFYEINSGQWNIPSLRALLEDVLMKNKIVDGFEVAHTFPILGPRTMLVNAREIKYENHRRKMLVSIFDITDQRNLEMEKERLIIQKDLLLKEMRHRIANSLQLIASILLLKAETVESKDSKDHLKDAHERIMSIALVQQQLEPVGIGESVDVKHYLEHLCKSLARSMISGKKPITLDVKADPGTVSSDSAVSLGLITTELVINCIKHAFPNNKSGEITVQYERTGDYWVLSVNDTGVGRGEKDIYSTGGLGTSIVGALANQLHAVIRTESSTNGMKVSVVHLTA